MKLSSYNNTIHINNKHTLIYNSFSGIFIIVKNKILDLSRLDFEDVRTNKPLFYKKLKDANVIVNNNANEIKRLLKRLKDSENNNNEYILHINPTLNCNFKCWYCYETHIKGSCIKEDDLNSIKLFIERILNKPQIKNLQISFFGGEPLLYFNKTVKPIIEFTSKISQALNKNFNIHFTSNGYLINDEMIEFLSDQDCNFQITLDGGKSFHDRTRFPSQEVGSYETITGNILKLIENSIHVGVRVNYTSENVDSVNEIFTRFKDIDGSKRRYINFDFQRVWQDRSNDMDDAEIKMNEIRDLFRKNDFLVATNYLFKRIEDSCYGDKKNYILINYNGDAYKCTARDFDDSNKIGKLVNGKLVLDKTKLKKRDSSKLSKEICLRCSIAPICGGGCKQKNLENSHHESCNFGYTQENIDDRILDIFEYYIKTQNDNQNLKTYEEH